MQLLTLSRQEASVAGPTWRSLMVRTDRLWHNRLLMTSAGYLRQKNRPLAPVNVSIHTRGREGHRMARLQGRHDPRHAKVMPRVAGDDRTSAHPPPRAFVFFCPFSVPQPRVSAGSARVLNKPTRTYERSFSIRPLAQQVLVTPHAVTGTNALLHKLSHKMHQSRRTSSGVRTLFLDTRFRFRGISHAANRHRYARSFSTHSFAQEAPVTSHVVTG